MHKPADAAVSEILAEMEHALAQDAPFGDADYLNNCTWKRYAHRLSMLTAHVPDAGDTLAALEAAPAESKYAVIGDPVVRRAINQGIVHLKMSHHEEPLEERLVAIIRSAGEQLRNGSTTGPLHLGSQEARLGGGSEDAWIWSDKAEENVGREYFRELFRLHLSHDGLTLKPASPENVEHLRKGRELLGKLLPELSRSALSHTHVVAIASHAGGFTAVTNPYIPGVIFLAEAAIRNPWEAADNLLHESLHAKFLDIEHTHTLMAEGYQPNHCSVRPAWRRPQSHESYLWPLTRIFTVTHVYVALSLLYSRMEQRVTELSVEYGAPQQSNFRAMIRQSLDRAEYLVHELSANQKHLGPAGKEFARWLTQLTELLDPSPRVAGSYLHHLAELYQREADVLAPRIAKLSPERLNSSVAGREEFHNVSLRQLLQEMMKAEIAAIQNLAQQAGQKVPWAHTVGNGLLEEVSESPATAAANLWAVRALLSQTLLQISPTRFTNLNEPAVLEDLLFSSSRHYEAALVAAQG